MRTTRRPLIVGAILLLSALSAGAALGTDGTQTVVDDGGKKAEVPHRGDVAEDDMEGPDRPITGTELDRASRAALDHLGGGRVTATEIDDEESYYEVEVTLDDGTQVDVQLDESFAVVGTD